MEIEKLTVANQKRVEDYIDNLCKRKRKQIKEKVKKLYQKRKKDKEKSRKFKELKKRQKEVNREIKKLLRKCEKDEFIDMKSEMVSVTAVDPHQKYNTSYHAETPEYEEQTKELEEMKARVIKAIIFKDLPKLRKEIEKLESL